MSFVADKVSHLLWTGPGQGDLPSSSIPPRLLLLNATRLNARSHGFNEREETPPPVAFENKFASVNNESDTAEHGAKCVINFPRHGM